MSVVGDRYAESLFDLAKEETKVTQYLDDIKLVGEVLDSDPQIVQFFNHVLIENDKKIQLLDQSFKGNVDQYVLNFLKLLVQSRRIRYIDDIVKSYINLSNQYLYIQAKNHLNFFEDFVTDYDLKDITHLQIEDELFHIYATKLIDSNVIDIFVKAKYYDISIHKQITKE